MEFFEEWVKHGSKEKNSAMYTYLAGIQDLSGIMEHSMKQIKLEITRFSAKLSEKWEKSRRIRERFLEAHAEWLRGELTFHICYELAQPSTSLERLPGPGRPTKDMANASAKTKRRRVDDLVTSRSSDELMVAAEISSRLSGNRTVAKLIQEINENPEKLKERKSDEHKEQRCLSSDEALAYYVDSKSTTHSYKQTRKWSMLAGHQVFPSFYSLRKAKKACLPLDEHVMITETSAEINLQALLNKTTERLVLAQNEVITACSSSGSECSSFILISKWGCDGSSGHSTYKQKFTNADDTDEFLFIFSLVPLQLRDESGNIIWQNPRPSSTMYCRPIKFMFAKESTDITVFETNKLLKDISELLPTICCVDGASEVSVKHELVLTMVDGKVCNALTETSSAQKCYICGATPKVMNDETRDFAANQDNLSFGLSTLHAWIRCFECLLHISYRLDVKKWQLRDASDKVVVKQRSTIIQDRFKKEIGLVVDKPKPGFGNSNDGNTARRFFANPELSAEITGLDVTLIKNFDTLLRALSSGFDINIESFKLLAQETKTLYLNLYSWYYMPVTVHKILVHSVDIIQSALLPIGQLSEEAQEARNKDCRRFRLNNTRKRSRIATNTDLLNMLIITSDPVINSLRDIPRKKAGSLPSQVLNLIMPSKPPVKTVDVPSYLRNDPEDYCVDDSSEDEHSDDE